MELETRADVEELLEAYLTSAALAAALELGVFWHLVDGARSLGALAEALGVPPDRCGPWLDQLVVLGLLERTGDAYTLSTRGRSAVVDALSLDTWRFLAQEAREDYPIGQDLTTRLRAPVRVPTEVLPTDVTDYVEKMRRDPERARRFTRMLYELHQPLAEEIAQMIDLSGVRRMLDLGGGSGVISLALLRANPELQVVVVDLPEVCAAGREIADGAPEGARLSRHPVADYLVDELPGGFDAVIQCDVDILTPAVFARVTQALVDGGRFFSVERAFDDRPPARVTDRLRAAIRDDLESYPSWEEIDRDLRAAGLEPVSVRDLPRYGWKIMEARKVAAPATCPARRQGV